MSLLAMSLAGGLIILAAVLIRALGMDRLPKRTFTALWTLAALRLTVPVRLPFRLSVWTLIRRAVPHAAGAAPVPADLTPPGQTAAGTVDIIQRIPVPDKGATFPAMTVLWLAGAMLCALVFAVVYIRGRRTFRAALPGDSAYLQSWLASHPLRRRIRIKVSDRIAAPLTYGALRPVILLPKGLDLEDGATLGFVLEHELAHIRRFDGARKLVLAGVACLHWFNPLVWAMFVLAGRDMELACDQAVLRALGPDRRKEYARTLLSMEEVRGGLGGLASGFSKNAIEERIHAIMKNQKRSFLSAVLALALVLGTGAAFATAAPEDEVVIGGAHGTTGITVSDTAPTVVSGDVIQGSDGTVFYILTTNGEPVTMTQEEYRALFTDPVEVEWWTAEEYEDWLEQEKKDLQDCLGQRAWTSADGWFTWTQEKIDETIAMYEQVLENIRNGLSVSKTVDGRTDIMLMQGSGDEDALTQDEGWTVYMMTQAEAAALQEQNEAIAAQRQQLEEQLEQLDRERRQIEQQLATMVEAEAETERQSGLNERLAQWDQVLAPYAPFGVTYEYDEETDDVRLFWNGERIRGIYDNTAGIWMTEHAGDGTWPEGTVEVFAVYEDGELTGLRKATEAEQAQWDALRAEAETAGPK